MLVPVSMNTRIERHSGLKFPPTPSVPENPTSRLSVPGGMSRCLISRHSDQSPDAPVEAVGGSKITPALDVSQILHGEYLN